MQYKVLIEVERLRASAGKQYLVDVNSQHSQHLTS